MENIFVSYRQLGMAVACAVPLVASTAHGEDTQEKKAQLEEVVVQAAVEQKFEIVPNKAIDSVVGFNKTLAETPRSVSKVSDDLIQSYGLRDLTDLIKMTPGTYTSSFFGINGSLDLRGEAADNYFRGIKRVENTGNYATPIRAAASVDIVRGPVSPMFGAGKVGGYMNFVPKSAKSQDSKYINQPTGEIGFTVGSYDQYVAFAEGGTPFEIGERPGGAYVYAEQEDSKSYYDYVEPRSSLVQIAIDFDLTDSLRTEFGGQYLKAERIQNAGWNRVTQDLIDHGTYVTGSPVNLNNGTTVLYPQDVRTGIGGADNGGDGNSLIDMFCLGYNNCPGFNPADTSLSALQNPGTAKLDGNQVMTDSLDRGMTYLRTAYFDLIKDFDNGTQLKNQLFYEEMDHMKYSTYGFTAKFDAYVWEDKLSYSFPLDLGPVETDNIVGANYRYYNAVNKQATRDQVFDRRDLIAGPSGNDRFDIGYDGSTVLGNGQYRRNFVEAIYSVTKNTGAFAMSDIQWNGWDLMLGYRYDYFDTKAADKAHNIVDVLLGDADGDGSPDWYSDTGSAESYNASLSYKTALGLIPYVTYAKAGALVTGSAGDVTVENILSGAWLQDSELKEAGIKYSTPSGHVYAAIAYFEQERSYYDSQSASNILVESKGFEGEVRWVISENFSMSGAVTRLDVTESGGPFTVLNGAAVAAANGLEPWQIYGFRFFDPSGNSLGDEWDRGGVPDWIVSSYLNYTQPFFDGALTASFGFTWVDETWADDQKQLKLPEYSVWNGSLGYEGEHWKATLNINNIFDERYFTSTNLYDSISVMPALPRTYSLTASYKFQ